MRLGAISSFWACNLSKNVNVIYLPTNHQRALGTRSKVSVRFRSNRNLKMLGFVEGGKPEYLEKNPRSKDENQQQTQPHMTPSPGIEPGPHWWLVHLFYTIYTTLA